VLVWFYRGCGVSLCVCVCVCVRVCVRLCGSTEEVGCVCCYTVVTLNRLLLHCCYAVVTLLLHCCYTLVTLLSHCCYTVVTLLFCCYTVVTLWLHRRYTVVTLNPMPVWFYGGCGVRLLLHFYFTVVKQFSHSCHTVVALLLHCCYTVGTLLAHCCYTVGTLVLHWCYTKSFACVVLKRMLCVCVCVCYFASTFYIIIQPIRNSTHILQPLHSITKCSDRNITTLITTDT
jgi:hypothetical protein